MSAPLVTVMFDRIEMIGRGCEWIQAFRLISPYIGKGER